MYAYQILPKRNEAKQQSALQEKQHHFPVGH